MQAAHPTPSHQDLGRALRQGLTRQALGTWQVAKARPDIVQVLQASNAQRQPHLVALRMARLAESPFACYRGTAGLMAFDLAQEATTGVRVLINGDAHLQNFGLYGTPQGEVVFDLNDFDEAWFAPWEWDVKRLAASLNLWARENDRGREDRAELVQAMALGYAKNMRRVSELPLLTFWDQAYFADPRASGLAKKTGAASAKVIGQAVQAARKNNHAAFFKDTVTQTATGAWVFRADPPILTPLASDDKQQVVDAMTDYLQTLPDEWASMLHRYRVVDVAHRVVGVGSVGARAYLVLLMGQGESDPLFLQVKEALPSVYQPYGEPYGEPSAKVGARTGVKAGAGAQSGVQPSEVAQPRLTHAFSHEGRRVVFGQHVMQSCTDILMGWTRVGKRPFYVRQMRNMKGSVPYEDLGQSGMRYYAGLMGAQLARSHACSADAGVISGYCGTGGKLAKALVRWSEDYATLAVADHARLRQAMKDKVFGGMG